MSWFHKQQDVLTTINGGSLVVVFRVANPPAVWRYDLKDNRSFTVALHKGEAKDTTIWDLCVVPATGATLTVAQFDTEPDALEAFDKVQKILMRRRFAKFWSVLKFLGWFLLLAALWFTLGKYIVAPFVHSSSSPISLSQGIPPRDIPQGVPVPADIMLNAPQSAPTPTSAVHAPVEGQPQSADDVLVAPR